MPTVPLPDNPSLEQLRKQAKELRDQSKQALRDQSRQALRDQSRQGPQPLSLTAAQRELARRYGFSSWPRLKRHVEVIEQYRRAPDEVAAVADPADEFLRLACLRYGNDDAPPRWAAARALLAAQPAIATASIHTAAAVADAAAVRRFLDRDPALARREGGPYGWEPLLYLAYTRHDSAPDESAVLDTARALLDAGADANAGYLWHGLPSPFTVLTGVLGSGEGGDNQPPHPHWLALATLLLDAGADANDAQALYNRQFGDDDGHLELLLAHGLGRGEGGPWRARLGPALATPRELARQQLWWAVVHDKVRRVGLLAEHGVDVRSAFTAPGGRPRWMAVTDGRTPADVAALCGSRTVLDELTKLGAPPVSLDGADALVAAALAADTVTVEKLRSQADEARARRPAAMVWAAAQRRPAAVALLAGLGFDVNALGRGDVPVDEPWETALHCAAGDGDVELARLLLSLGADPNVRDARFASTPLGWAEHFGRGAVVELLEPVTG